MNCQSVKLLLSEFLDERLDAAEAWQVQTHLSGCATCRQISREMESVKRVVRALPALAPSAGFDAALAQRLALTRRSASPVQNWQTKIAAFQNAPARRLRPALALGFVLAAGSIAVFSPLAQTPPPAPAATHSADPAFVADCVAQHHRDAASEPLADLSAQTLAGSLDGSASSDPALDSSTAPASGPAGDTGLF